MRTTHLLLASTALLIAAMPALADDNFANVDQSGDGNSGLVTQGPGDGNRAGTADLAVTQGGNANILTFLQAGDDNSIGTAGSGFRQASNRSTATITQSSDGNTVGQVTQTGIGSTTGGVTLRRNVLTIVQEAGDGNTVGVVAQSRTSFSPAAAANTASLTQTGGGNSIGTLLQSGYAQSAMVVQAGDDNSLGRLEQAGSRNTASVSVSGSGNGQSDFHAGTEVAGAWRSLVQGHIYQNNDFFGAGLADANTLTLVITGNGNSYGFSQIGVDNTVTGVVAEGDGNQAGAVQLGIGNLASFTLDGSDNHVFIDQARWAANIANEASALVTGDANGVGILQSGTNNLASVAITGSGNLINVDQESLLLGNLADLTVEGDDNGVTLTQAGNNAGTVDIAGSRNLLMASQDGLGNTLELSIRGDDNNAAGSSFSGVALATSLLTSAPLTPGRIVQSGAGNSILYDIGTLVASNDNRFAFSQIGSGNQIVGTTNGNGNQVVIVQSGSQNFASFTQTGVGNIIGVSQ